MKQNKKAYFSLDGKRYNLETPHLMPKADTFLWNHRMLAHVTALGFSQTQFMQPEPTMFSHAPLKSEKAAMAPEPQYFDHHPGRFFYVKNKETNEYFSAPMMPTNIPLDKFTFSPGLSDVKWIAVKDGIKVELQFALPYGEDVVELWKVSLTNISEKKKSIRLYPYFPVGFPSWMNTEGKYSDEIQGMLAYTLTPYRKLDDYYKIKQMKDYVYLVSDKKSVAWCASAQIFEGMGGLRKPDAINNEKLDNIEAAYETTACIMQYDIQLSPSQKETINFIFGPANNIREINGIKRKYLTTNAIDKAVDNFNSLYLKNKGCIEIETEDKTLDHFINHWLPRQIIYHAKTLRMVTDPQTRNHIQDVMGMTYIDPVYVKELYNLALSQQHPSGEMPDGILLTKEAELKFTNQIPHRDHCVWAAYAISAYLDETNDYEYLNRKVAFSNGEIGTVYEHVARGIEWLIADRSERGLSYIGQGDWNDPMNMVGHKGKGESIWLTEAMSYAIRLWLPLAELFEDKNRVNTFKSVQIQTFDVLNSVAWNGKWYARGFNDDGVAIGVQGEKEGEIFLNSQSFAILSGACTGNRLEIVKKEVEDRLMTPFGLELLTPSFTHMDERIGRVTQKHPSTAENGSVYCHANAFYAYALQEHGYGQEAFDILRCLIPGPDTDDLFTREHLPIYIPNYYRGRHNPRVAGKASHLMNTGSLPWIYRCFVEGVFGLKGCKNGILINPQLPKSMNYVKVNRKFRGKKLSLIYEKNPKTIKQTINLNGKDISGSIIKDEELKDNNLIIVRLPI